MNKIVQTNEDASKRRRVEFFERSDGTYGFEHLKFLDKEKTWVPIGRFDSRSDTLTRAIDEALDRIAWLTLES